MEWIKLYTRKWIWGSGRTMTPEKRGVWIDLLALAGESKLRDGTLRHDINQPMKKEWIASVLMLDMETLNSSLEAFKADINSDDGDARIKIWEDGTIQIVNWDKYQNKSEKQLEKMISKQIAISKTKETNRRKDALLDGAVRMVNEINTRLSLTRYEVLQDGNILDKKTGVLYTLDEFEKINKGGN